MRLILLRVYLALSVFEILERRILHFRFVQREHINLVGIQKQRADLVVLLVFERDHLFLEDEELVV